MATNGWVVEEPHSQVMVKPGGAAAAGGKGLAAYQAAPNRSAMSLMAGERLVYQASELGCLNGCRRGVQDDAGGEGALANATGIMLTDRRITFHWVSKLLYCLPSTEQEESFAYSDVQFVWVRRGISYIWLVLGIACFGAGIGMLVAGSKLLKEDPDRNMYMGIGAGLLVAGLLMVVLFIVMLFLAGMYLHISFSRASKVHIWDWPDWPWARAPAAKRYIKLTPEAAHAAMYTIMSHPLVYNAKLPHGNPECL
mmetsp:Transcript_2427/g.6193  ORF Transcript_2427/g.6193 Transcript_2427/m.6193 type:complete len:253 (-) Transcript_2427:442-1200(-)|eukprot:CAMPEP_0202858876 /NCGR_PEP_ID=MMETSP1391-20130828/1217_1 /ASSEMBLY_ACC=CAM_ASM_000867 /TAXON_ID=1034604 /ORGANISM="Chlamydomonas leiostraca, Strain SAG 11-49" /LENGTH=252 /DNA_ID=CAMNT_0049537843 /DNA_START=82 /DNA_END=840 /DNA_ORIENTATION=+